MKLEEGEEQDPSLAMGHLALGLLPRTGPVPPRPWAWRLCSPPRF